MSVRRRWLPAAAVVLWCVLLAGILWNWPVDGDDAYHHSVLAVEQVKCWQQGVIWPRFHPDWNGGTGSFLPSVYAPLTLAAEGLACMVAGDGTRAVGLVLAGSLLAGALLLWWALRTRGLGGGLAWVAAAYPLAAILARSTTTEMMALAFAGPALVLGLPPGPRTRSQGVALAAAVALILGCQVGMALMVALVLAAAWIATLWHSWSAALRAAGWFSAGILAGGLFWWPTVHDFAWMARGVLVRGEYDWRTHHVLALSANAELGPLLLGVFVSLLVVLIVLGRTPVGKGVSKRAVLGGMAAALFLATPLSMPVWKLAAPMAALQFPWRFLGPATLLALVAVSGATGLTRRVAIVLAMVPVVLVPVELRPDSPGLTPSMNGRELARVSSVAWGLAPVLPSMPGFFAPGFNVIKSLRKLRDQSGIVERTSRGCGFPQVFEVTATSSSTVLLPLQWWPELAVRSERRPLAYENVDGLVAVELPAGKHRITAALGPSHSRRVGMLISLTGLLLAGSLWIVGWRFSRASQSAAGP
ncbi:MAG: hypothetical protein GXP47_13595 [Acidobacteria bacterium]|nr:hypothetical protein [Acidobacteriota bacterium]